MQELVASDPGDRNYKGILIAILFIGIILASVAVSVVILTPPEEDDLAKGEKFSIQDLSDPKFSYQGFNGSWISGRPKKHIKQEEFIFVFEDFCFSI